MPIGAVEGFPIIVPVSVGVPAQVDLNQRGRILALALLRVFIILSKISSRFAPGDMFNIRYPIKTIL